MENNKGLYQKNYSFNDKGNNNVQNNDILNNNECGSSRDTLNKNINDIFRGYGKKEYYK